MEVYKLNWVNCRMPSGKDFAVAVCGYSAKVCYLVLGADTASQILISQARIDQGRCDRAGHCLAFGCDLNRTEPVHAMHMMEMFQDESADEETARLWGTDSVLEGLLDFSLKMNDILPEELRQKQAPQIE